MTKPKYRADMVPHHPWCSGVGDLGDDAGRVRPAPLGERPVERRSQFVERRIGVDGSVVERVEELGRVVGRQAEQVLHGVHNAPR